LPVFLVAGLLADEGDRSADGAFAENRVLRIRHQRFCRRDHGIEGVERLGLGLPGLG